MAQTGHPRGVPNFPRLEGRPEWAAALALARLASGLTQQQVAEAAGITQSQLSQYERGLHKPGQQQMARIERALGTI